MAPHDWGARKGQEVREMTRDLDMLKIEIDVIDTMIRLRGAHGAPPAHEEAAVKPVEPEGE